MYKGYLHLCTRVTVIQAGCECAKHYVLLLGTSSMDSMLNLIVTGI